LKVVIGKHTAKDLEQAVQEAQAQLDADPPPPDAPKWVQLKPEEIVTRPELFQPREFAWQRTDVDKWHAKKLAKHINHVGELDPIVVIRLGDQWVCVDGHHRLEGYKIEKWSGTIKCEWFKGTAWEAANHSLRANTAIKLEIPPTDRFENAWKRVLIGRDSKKEIKELCGVSDGMIAKMRRVQKAFTDGPEAKELRAKLGGPLNGTSWWKANLVWSGFDKKQIDRQGLAAGLAKTLRSRLEDRLSKDPKVTATALMIYDPDLFHPLTNEMLAIKENYGADTSSELAKLQMEIDRRETVSDDNLRKKRLVLEEMRAKCDALIGEIKTELQMRGALPKSELIWEKWQLEDAARREQENTMDD
jgi:hypothetical protein